MAFKYLPKTLELNFILQFSFVELDSSSNRTHHQHKVLNAKFEVKVSHLFTFELNYGPTKGTRSILDLKNEVVKERRERSIFSSIWTNCLMSEGVFQGWFFSCQKLSGEGKC